MKKLIMLVMLIIGITLALAAFADAFFVSEDLSSRFSGYSLYRYERLGKETADTGILCV